MSLQTTEMITPDSLSWECHDFDNFFALASISEHLAVDTETTGLGPDNDIRDGRGYCQGVSVAFRGLSGKLHSAYFPFRHVVGANLDKGILLKLKELIENHPCVVMHNAKYDIVSLATLGIKQVGFFYDTMLIAHLLNENLFSKELDYLAKIYLHDEGKKKSEEFLLFQKNGWIRIPSFIMAEYAAYDTDLTLRLLEFLLPKFKEESLEETWDHKQKFLRLIIKMESRGITINQDLATRQGKKGRFMLDDLANELGFNPGSSKQIGVFLCEELGLPVVKRTPNGNPCFDKWAMEIYEEILDRTNDDRARLILEYRGWQKATTSCYEPYVLLCSPDGRLRPGYKLHGTVTGRLSCEKPNLQQIPRKGEKAWNGDMKSCFIPEEGFTLWEADYSQLELRLGAAYAKEKSMLEIFADDSRDIFSEMAERLGMERFVVKTMTYTIQYGGGATRLSQVFGVSMEEGAKLKDDYYAAYPGIASITRMAAVKCKAQRYLKLWSGRRRHFQRPSEESHKAFNSIIQGGAADIVERTMLRLDEAVDSDDCRMLLQVHDSVVFEIRNGMEAAYLPRIRTVMEDVSPDFGVVFRVDIHRWGTDDSWSE